jgi:hypothetical protein
VERRAAVGLGTDRRRACGSPSLRHVLKYDGNSDM